MSAILSAVVCFQAQPVGGGLFPAASMGMRPDLGSNRLPGAAQVRYG